MGSSGSTQGSSRNRLAQLKEHELQLRREKEKLEIEKNALQQQQLEQHWREQRLIEEQKLKETRLEWERKFELNQVKLEQTKIRKELEEQKKQRALQIVMLEKSLREQKATPAQQNDERAILNEAKPRQQKCKPSSPIAEPPIANKAPAPRIKVAVQQKAPAAVETIAAPKPNEKPKSYPERMSAANVKYKEWSIVDYMREKTGISEKVAANIIKLFDEGNTVAFVARYRGKLTRGMTAQQLRRVKNNYDEGKSIKRQAVVVVKEIEQKGLWTPEFHALVQEAKSLNKLELIRLIFGTEQNEEAKESTLFGLDNVANACLQNKTFLSPAQLVQDSLRRWRTEKQVKDGLISVIAFMILRDPRTFRTTDELMSQYAMAITTSKLEGARPSTEENDKYKPYHNFKSTTDILHYADVLAIDKGEELKILEVRRNLTRQFESEFKRRCLLQYDLTSSSSSSPRKELIAMAVNSVYARCISNYVIKIKRDEISKKAIDEAAENLELNVRQYLLNPPVGNVTIMGISPGFQDGCKLAVISWQGEIIATETIYPHDSDNPGARMKAKLVIVEMICRLKCRILALGNGEAREETELFLTSVLKHKSVASLNVGYVIVNESASSNYGCSGKETLGILHNRSNMDGAAFVARILQDPMAALVKPHYEQLKTKIFDPGYPDKWLTAKLNEIIVDTVSYVGVDLNTASVDLLKSIAGLDEARANSIVDWRKNNGPFTNRNDLLKVNGIGKKIFQQCSGFVRIKMTTAACMTHDSIPSGAFHWLDNTWIHPESYNVAQSLLNKANCDVRFPGSPEFMRRLDAFVAIGYAKLAEQLNTDVETVKMIVRSLKMDRDTDVRGMVDPNIFRKSLIRFDHLTIGAVLTGIVTNLTTFGAFVEVGAEIDGLIHKNFMNGMTVAVDQKVVVRISRISKERRRLGLVLVRCI